MKNIILPYGGFGIGANETVRLFLFLKL